jgi:hypothetical protein
VINNLPPAVNLFLDREEFLVEVKVNSHFVLFVVVGSDCSRPSSWFDRLHGVSNVEVAALIGRAASRLSIFFVLLLGRSLAGRVDMSTIFYSFF